LFLTATWLLPLGYVFVKLLVAGAKRKRRRRRRKERKKEDV
jgi:hypothetical protein